MGTISVSKLGGLSLIVGPVLALIGYFLQPGGMLIDAADPASASASVAAINSNASLSQITGFVIPVGLIIFLYGLFVVQGNVKGNGNGDALSRYGIQLFLIAVIGWVISSALSNAIAGVDLTPKVPAEVAAQAAAAASTVASGLYAATMGINTTSAVFGGLGFTTLSLALSTRDDHNKIFALVVAAAGLISVLVALVGGFDSSQLQTLQPVSGICYIIIAAWSITLGLGLVNKE